MMAPALALALLALGALAMLAVPFIPMWHEWRHPTDHAPLPVRADDSNVVDYFARQLRARLAGGHGGALIARDSNHVRESAAQAIPVYAEGDFEIESGSSVPAVLAEGKLAIGSDAQVTEWAHAEGEMRLGAGTTALRRVSSGTALFVEPDCCFERLHAPVIHFGEPLGSEGVPAEVDAELDVASLPGATVRAPGHVRIDRDTVLAARTRYRGSLVVLGSLTLDEGAVLAGSAKAYEGVIVGRGAAVEGALVCRKSTHMLEGSRVAGPLASEGDVVMSPGVIVGSPTQPTTVTAENVMVAEGVTVHGTVWAHDIGVVWRPLPA
jgi:predicted acyltransferase (DUF342 family)